VGLIVVELVAVVAALFCASLLGLPGLRATFLRRRRSLRECLSCGRTLVLGRQTCDCD